MRRLIIPAFVLLFFVLESIFVELLPSELFSSDRIFVPHFLLIVILFLAVYGGKTQGLVYAAIFGLLFDIVYTEIIGVYLFLYPLLTYIVIKAMKLVHSHLVVVTLVSCLAVAALELAVYEINYLLNVTEMSFDTFLELRFYSTIILNIAFTILLAFPLKRQFEKYAERLKNEYGV